MRGWGALGTVKVSTSSRWHDSSWCTDASNTEMGAVVVSDSATMRILGLPV